MGRLKGKQTLKTLLRWAERQSLYISVAGNGFTEIENPPEYEYLASGVTLYSALVSAKKELLERTQSGRNGVKDE